MLGAEDTTSPYSLSWNTTTATNGTHTLAARARDAAGNIGDSAPTAVIVDNQPPTGTVQINGGAAATNSRTVTLSLSATDALSNVTQMRFSNNGTSFSAAESYAPTKTWTLSSGAGTKTVYAQFRDAAGNWSSSATDTIVLDTTAPTISSRTATNITANSATITWTTNEPATSKVDYGPTTSYGSTTTLDPNLVTSHNVTLVGLSANTTYNYRVRSIDAAGNERVSANSTFRTARTRYHRAERDDQSSGGPSGSDEHEPDQLYRDLQRDGDGLYRERHQLCGQHGGRHALGGGDRHRPDVQRGGVGDDGETGPAPWW